MAKRIRLIWCQGGNRRSAALAISAGWWYGFRSDSNHHAATLGPVVLLDSHWEEGKVNWPRHLAAVALHRPWLAAVPDVMALEEIERALRRAEELAPYCDHPLIIPKAPGVIGRLPREIGGKALVLGYSVPTSYGGTELCVWDFAGWPVHLLGGNARRQVELCGYMDVISVDGNLAWRLARRGVTVRENGAAGPTLKQADGQRWSGENGCLEALRRSLINLKSFWLRHTEVYWRPDA